jgi:hypothetical protein
MNSELNSFLLSSSNTVNSIETELKKVQLIYTTWIHIRTAHDGETSYFKYYSHCMESPSYGTIIITNIRYYVKTKY